MKKKREKEVKVYFGNEQIKLKYIEQPWLKGKK